MRRPRLAGAPAGGRVLIVSNRLPLTVRARGEEIEVVPSSGGLATGLRGVHDRSRGVWIGWSGTTDACPPAARAAVRQSLADAGAVEVSLSDAEVAAFYARFANGVLWPLLHDRIDQPAEWEDWRTYRAVNERFADVVARHLRPGDRVWVHDYHLMLVPRLLRDRCPGAHVGFFLHTPFPDPESLGALPQRAALLDGLLGADVIGFHTPAYAARFGEAVERTLGLARRGDGFDDGERHVQVRACPMSVDVASFQARASDPRAAAEVARLRGAGGPLLVGVDRLDYTKGIPERLAAFARLLERRPDLRGHARLVQLAVPSREEVPAYRALRADVERRVASINARFGTAAWTPVEYAYGSVDDVALSALYRAADVMVVTPLRDGMNLVAKEFVACREDENGVLILSELAGAAEELNEAVIVNPFDVEGIATEMQRALDMDVDERRRRMRALRHRVLGHDVGRWAETMVNAISAATPVTLTRGSIVPSLSVRKILDRLASVPQLVLLLDYDGTLVPFQEQPELAVPSQTLLGLLRDLAAHPGHTVHLVSGRTRETLDRWFGDVPIALWAEHGLWRRPNGSAPWELITQAPRDWMPGVRELLSKAVASTPGSMLEEKTASIAWHYRLVTPPLAQTRRTELRQALLAQLAAQPVEILEGHLVLEVRPSSINKGSIVKAAMADAPADAVLLAIGDDRTDEDMFAALPEGSVAVRVGDGDTRAHYRLLGPAAVLALLELLADRP
jgi:trehalose 6-phosphate synthase/phosphatase